MTEHGKFDDFDAIIHGFRRELEDPVVVRLFDKIRKAERALNQEGGEAVQVVRSAELLSELNEFMDEAGLLYEEMLVSGRVRPTLLEEFDEDELPDDIFPPELKDLGPILTDDHGSYIPVSQATLRSGALGTDSVLVDTIDGVEKWESRIVFNLNADLDDDDSGCWTYAYLEDLDLLKPVEPSDLKVRQEINEMYPEIAAQLRELPHNCGDDAAIIDALSNFRLVVDWSKYPRIDTEGRLQLLDYIERYITDRVVFDTTAYTMTVRDILIAVDPQGNRSVQELPEPITLSGKIGHARLLHESAADDGSLSHYRMMVELLAPSAARGGGNHLLYIPAAAVSDVHNTRNSFTFQQPMEEFDDPADNDELLPPPIFELVGDEGDDDGPEFTVEVIKNGDTDMERVSENERELAALDARIKELFAAATEITAQLYPSHELAIAARDRLNKLVHDFTTLYPDDRPIVLDVAGPGVHYLQLDRDPNIIEGTDEDRTIQLNFRNYELHSGDPLMEKQGIYQRKAHTYVLPVVDTDNFAVITFLMFGDTTPEAPIGFGPSELGIAMYTLSPSRQFFANLNGKEVSITIPEYERLKRGRDAIKQVGKLYPDLEGLPEQLTKLYDIFVAADPNTYTELADVSLVNAIGDAVGGDEEASRLVVDVLADVFIGRPVQVVGDMYDDDGRKVHGQHLRSMVSNVVATNANIEVLEPMLVIEAAEGKHWYVPLSSIQRVSY